MKKIMTIALAAAFAATVWADRTANREWVQRNFAPTNLVPRVEALEAGGGGEETDPVFASWKVNSVNVAIGKEAAVGEENSVSIGPNTSTDDGCTAVGAGAIALNPKSVAMGYQAGAFRNRAIALGSYAECNGSDACQIGCGTNDTANTLRFMNWPLVGSDGKIPADRLSAANVLTSIKTMNATQLAELKTFLGIE